MFLLSMYWVTIVVCFISVIICLLLAYAFADDAIEYPRPHIDVISWIVVGFLLVVAFCLSFVLYLFQQGSLFIETPHGDLLLAAKHSCGVS